MKCNNVENVLLIKTSYERISLQTCLQNNADRCFAAVNMCLLQEMICAIKVFTP